jgi:hypothetical protein
MSRYPFDEFTNVIWVPDADGIANMAAPTAAELATGTDLTCFITKDGLNPGGSTSKITSGALCSRVNGQTVGSVQYDGSLKMYRDNGAGGDDAWDLAEWGNVGFLVIRRGILYGSAIAAGQKVEVYEAQMGEPVMASSAENANQTFTVDLAVQDAELKATVAA